MASEHSGSRFDEGSRDGAGPFWAHDLGLFDQNESSAGYTIDDATGKPINNSSHSYDDFRTLTDEAAGELGFIVIDGDGEYENRETVAFIDHWLETQNGLAKAAETGMLLDHDEIA